MQERAVYGPNFLRRAVIKVWLAGLLAIPAVGIAGVVPANDDFSAATTITGLSGTTSGATSGATLEVCEPTFINADDFANVSKSVWFQWTAPVSGTLRLDTIGSDFDTVLAVYTTTSDLCTGLTLAGANDDTNNAVGPIAYPSQLNVSVTAGITYYISVNGNADNVGDDVGNFTLNWSSVLATVPSGDFQFSSSRYSVSQRDSSGVLDSSVNPSVEGARITVTRTGAAHGRVLVDYAADPLTYTNIFTTNTFGTNITQIIIGPGGIIETNSIYTTSVFSNYFQYYQDGYNRYVLAGAVTNTTITSGPAVVVLVTNITVLVNTNGPRTPVPAGPPPNLGASTTNFVPPSFTNIVSDNATFTNTFVTNVFQSPYVILHPGVNTLSTNTFGTNIFVSFFGLNGIFITNSIFTTTIYSNVVAGITNFGALTNYILVSTNKTATFVITAPTTSSSGGLFLPTPTNAPPLTAIGFTNSIGTSITVDTNAGITTIFRTNLFQLQSTFSTQLVASVTTEIGLGSGTLVFDDFQMSQDILLPLQPSGFPAVALVSLTNPRLDTLESTDLLPPALGTINTAMVGAVSPTFVPPVNIKSILNFERSTFRVQEDEGAAVIHVLRVGGDSTKAVSVQYRIDHGPGNNNNDTFTLQAGSDYATPDDDYTSVSGTLNWGANDFSPKSISIPINDDGIPEFNEDLLLELFNNDTDSVIGQVGFATLTILFDDQPAGAVDRTWNKNNASDSNPPFLDFPGTSGGVSDSANGNGGTVYAVAEQPDGKAIVAGSFISFDSHPYNRIVRLLSNGYQDTSFLASPNSGANGFITSVNLRTNGQILIGGGFTAFNGVNRHGIACLNANGTVNTSFNPGLGADGTVWAVAERTDGKILIGGDFTHVNGAIRHYLARLNADGSLDTSFDPGSNFNGPIYAISATGSGSIQVNGQPSSGNELEQSQVVNVGATSGTMTLGYDMLFVPDDIKVFYGTTNVAAGTGVLIYDSGPVSTYDTNTFLDFTNFVTIPFGPTNGLTTNILTIVMNQGNGTFGTVWFYEASVETVASGRMYVGGAFDHIGSAVRGGVARVKDDGSLDNTFNPGIGTYNPDTGFVDPIYALAQQADGRVLVGGAFANMELSSLNGLARLNTDGTVDETFNPGIGTLNPLTGIADTVFAIKLQTDSKILIGGDFTTFNGTRRMGIARLFDYGSVDTSFIDTAYLQFAGVPNHFHNPNAVDEILYPQGNQRNYVDAIALESGGNVIIGGGFLRVGGGSTRDDIRNRSNVARLIGGTTPGPGNIALSYSSYTVDENAGQLYVSLVRTNGNLGFASATFVTNTIQPGPGIATATDFSLDPVYSQPSWLTAWPVHSPGAIGWMYSDGIFGPNYSTTPFIRRFADVYLAVANNTNITGNLNADLGLVNPSGTNFFLGGETIPLGVALGWQDAAPLTIIDDSVKPGVIGFSSSAFSVLENAGTATITVTRTNGSDGIVNVSYATTNGTATSPTNYTSVTGTLQFRQGDLSKTFTIPIVNGTTVQPDQTVLLNLYNVTGGGSLGRTNAVLTIINDNFTAGHISFSAPSYATNEDAGVAQITVTRTGGASGVISITAITSNGTATNGVNYIGSTNVLTWNNNDATNKVLFVPLIRDNLVTTNLTVNLRLTNALLNTKFNANILGLSLNTNTVLTINNVDASGTVHFESSVYSVKKYGRAALVPVVRTGGSAQTVSVNFSTIDGTAQAGTHYVTTNGVLNFAAGEVIKYISVPIIDNGISNGLKSLTIVLTNPVPAYAAGSPASAVLNIIDTASVNETPGSVDTTYSPFVAFNDAIYTMVLQTNNALLVGGDFTLANNVPRQRIARLLASGELDPSFSLPSSSYGADGSVRAIALQTDGRIVIGGSFATVNSVASPGLARLNPDGSLDSLFNVGSGADNPVYALAQTFAGVDRKILVGGAFTTINGTPIGGIGRLNADGTTDDTFNIGGAGANGTVYALAVQADGKIVIGGDFTSINGIAFNHLGRLNADGSLDLSFSNAVVNPNAGANDSVRSIAIQPDGRILIGGLFTSVNGATFSHIARLNSNGTTDNTFTPGLGANDSVLCIAVQTDGRIILGGDFTRCSDVNRNRLTRLNPDGTVDPTINFGTGADDFVAAIAIQQDTITGYPADVPDEKILIAGGFTQYNGESHQHLTRLYGGAISGSGAFEFSAANYQVEERNGSTLITILRTGGTSGTNSDGSGSVFVSFATSNNTAIAGINYSNVVTTLDFPEGEVLRTVVIPVKDDFTVTPDLTVDLSINPILPAEFGNQPTAVLTIVNDDSTVSFSASAYQVAKNAVNGAASIHIQRQGSSRGGTSVLFATTTNGTASAGLDYFPTTNVVTFEVGVTDIVQTVAITNNGLPRGDRTVTMALSSLAGSILSSPTNAVLTIRDTTTSPGQLSFSTTNYFVSEGVGAGFVSLTIPVVRTNGSFGTVAVNFNTVDGTATTASGKYVATNGVVTFADGETNKTLVVRVSRTSTVDPVQTFSVVLSNATGGATLIAPSTATVTILNTNTGVTVSTPSVTVSETAAFAVVNISRINNVVGTTTVHFATADGTALAGVNYSATSGTLTFTNGESLKAIPVPLIDNTNVTGDQAFSVNLSSPGAGAQLVSPVSATVVLQDADAGIHFTNAAMTVAKNGGSAVVTVVCSSTNPQPVSVSYYTQDGSAVAGVNYLSAAGTLTFSNGMTTTTFTVSILNNTLVQSNLAFDVVLTNATGRGHVVSPGKQTVTIAESNSGLRFSSANYTVLKTGGSATINVVRTGNLSNSVSIDYVATNGTAISGANYTPTTGNLVFTNGVTNRSFTISIVNYPVIQPDVTVLLQLQNATNAVLVSPNAATLTIHDNTGSYVVPAGSALVSETGAGAPNGIINSNETVTILFAFRDAGGTNVANLIATLVATNGVTSPTPASQTYGPLTYLGHSVSQPFTFTAAGTNGQQINALFQLKDGVKDIGTALFGYRLGSATAVFSNTAPIIINDNTIASPYPSIINVGGIGGSLVKATVTWTNVSHTSPGDIDVLLVAPNQQDALIMAHSGGQNALNHVTITFDDAATNSLSHFGQITNGVYKPTSYTPTPNFP